MSLQRDAASFLTRSSTARPVFLLAVTAARARRALRELISMSSILQPTSAMAQVCHRASDRFCTETGGVSCTDTGARGTDDYMGFWRR